ncbi:MAG: hypothetical protein AAGA48_31175 [Myxococcota bacterium]
MARSLTVEQEESPRASLLFLMFVGLCCGLLVLTWATVGSTADAGPELAPVEAPPAE